MKVVLLVWFLVLAVTNALPQSQRPLSVSRAALERPKEVPAEARPQVQAQAQLQAQSQAQAQAQPNSILDNLFNSIQAITDPLIPLAQGHGHTSRKSLVDDWLTPAVFKMQSSQGSSSSSNSIPDRPPLVNFENNVPPRRLPDSSLLESTTITLLTHSFANSYGHPSRITYSPTLLPTTFQDPTRWTSLSLNQEGKARGRQFDRLGSIYLHNVEVVRTDNAEPVNTTGGIIWRTKKDVSRYFDLFTKDGELVFDYPNIVDETYTSPLNLTLELTVQQVRQGSPEDTQCQLEPLHNHTPKIYPITKSGPTQFLLPNDTASVTITTPRNAKRALLEIYASGTAQDEFWYTAINDDVYSRVIDPNHVLTPHGPYREIQVTIDGNVAGIAAPYPVIFTGGINPLLWRPQASWGSYDQPTYLFDVTPFLGLVSDGKPHSYGIQVKSAESDEQIPSGWFVTGNLQLELDQDEHAITIGEPPSIQGPGPVHSNFDLDGSVGDGNFTGETGSLSSNAKTHTPRAMTIVSKLVLAGSVTPIDIRVQHSLTYSSKQEVQASSANTTQVSSTIGSQRSFHGDVPFMNVEYDFPLAVGSSSSGQTLSATVQSGYKISVGIGAADGEGCKQSSAFGLPASHSYDVKQDAQADTRIVDGKLAGGLGGNNVSISYADSMGLTFDRTVKTYNYTVTDDELSGTLMGDAPPVR